MTYNERVLESVLSRFDQLAEQSLRNTVRFLITHGATEREIEVELDYQRDDLAQQRQQLARRVADEMAPADTWDGRGQSVH